MGNGVVRVAPWSVLCVGLVVLVVGAAWSVTPLRAQSRSAPEAIRRTVAVFPFANISAATEDEWLGPGISQSLVAELSQRDDIRLLDPDQVRLAFERARDDIGSDAAVLALAQELGADLLLTGGYQRLGDRLRVTARLIAVETAAIVRSTIVDGVVDDLFELQDRVAADLAEMDQSVVERRSVAARSSAPPVASDTEPRTPPAASLRPETTRRTTGGALGTAAILNLTPGAPPPPAPPEIISRSETGQATLRAVRLERALSLDGALDDSVYQEIPPITGFIQTEPNAGEPATERTDAWIFFDDANVYIAGRAWDSTPESNWIANEMRRDSFNILNNENIGFALDTFFDRRNSVVFNVTPLGGRMDGQVVNERSYNRDWNPVWDLRTGRFDGGWSFEASIPFKSLRYRPGRSQVWGVQMRREVLWKNETSYLVPIDRGLGRMALLQASQASALVGLEAPESGRTLEIKPYLIGDVSSNLTASPAISNQAGGNVGIDLIKYGVTQNLTADFTVNTDFAQVEADEQQVNLTRFSLFFPEKREFFLENQGVFSFGTGGGGFGGSQDAPILFYSRRIGLSGGQEVPILAGGRLTGRAGAFTLGVLSIQTDEDTTAEALTTNFSVFRVSRDILRRSSIGAILTNRSVSTNSPEPGSNQAYGVDAALAFYDDVSISGYWAKTQTTGLRGKDTSYSGDLRYNGDRYGVAVEHLFVDELFSPEVGFLRRDDMRKSFGLFRFSPRPTSLAAIRKVSWEGSYNYITDASGFVETREPQGRFGIELENSDQFSLTHTQTYDFLKEPFEIADDVVIPVGAYDFHNTQASYTFGSQRRLSGDLSFERGTFYGGTKSTIEIGGSGRGAFGGGRVEISSKLSLEPGMSINWVSVPQGDFTTTLVTTRATYTLTPLTFVSALVQYNSSNDALSTNIRLRWEYHPGSELFVVYNEQRDTLVPSRFAPLENRTFIVKLNRLFRF